MPRNLLLKSSEGSIISSKDSLSGINFRRLALLNKLDTVVVLTEKHEYKMYAGIDNLELFYDSIGVKVIVHPIRDFSIPSYQTFLLTAKVC